jgi:hypothetical protein
MNHDDFADNGHQRPTKQRPPHSSDLNNKDRRQFGVMFCTPSEKQIKLLSSFRVAIADFLSYTCGFHSLH